MMLSPPVVSLPVKLLLFVMVDGWALIWAKQLDGDAFAEGASVTYEDTLSHARDWIAACVVFEVETLAQMN